MSGVEIDRIRSPLATYPQPGDLVARRQRVDSLGADDTLSPDAKADAVVPQGVPAEWTRMPAFFGWPDRSSDRNAPPDCHEPR